MVSEVPSSGIEWEESLHIRNTIRRQQSAVSLFGCKLDRRTAEEVIVTAVRKVTTKYAYTSLKNSKLLAAGHEKSTEVRDLLKHATYQFGNCSSTPLKLNSGAKFLESGARAEKVRELRPAAERMERLRSVRWFGPVVRYKFTRRRRRIRF